MTAALFLAALFLTPVIGVVPGFATAPALVVVGVFMFRNVARIDFRDFAEGVPAFLTIILMPLTFSTLPRSVISPLIATSGRTLSLVSSEASATKRGMPAAAPSFGTAPAGK